LDLRISALENDNARLKLRADKAKTVAVQSLRAAVSASTNMKAASTALKKSLARVKEEIGKDLAARDLTETAGLSRDVNALMNWKVTLDERIGSLEMDLRSEDGLLFSMVQECKSLAAAGDAGSFTIAGYTMQNEESVLAMIQPLSHKNNYAVFSNLKMLLSLCGDDVVSLEGNMLLHKAAKGADFEDTFTARVNTSHVVEFPAVFGRKSTSGDTSKMVWNQGFKSHAAFAGGMKSGGKTGTERKLRKVVDMFRNQINRRLPPRKFPMQNAIASAMLDQASLACFDFLDAISKFYAMMVSTGLSPTSAWTSTTEFMTRVFEEIEYVSTDAGEEDMDAGFIWTSMLICNKVTEFQRFRWSEHPSICSMLMFSVLERMGEERVTPEDSAAAAALEQCRANHAAIQELVEKQKADHEKAADAINQVKQLKDSVKAGKKPT
jgi:hypothetical protein